jgi:MinD superfamily P-loop ATPase
MRVICVASGKGGAGKTSIAAALAAALGQKTVFADCDVDAANGAIALGASIVEREAYVVGGGLAVDKAKCVGCGACLDACRFEAIRMEAGVAVIIPELCERCGACLDRCPASAIQSFDKKAGELFVSVTPRGIAMVHAELGPGEETSGKLVHRVRERAARLAGPGSTIVVDSPPGIGCPVIASLAGADLVLVVIEASASGIRDAERLIALARGMRRSSLALINKTGLSVEMDRRARALAASSGLTLAGEIGFEPRLRSAEESGKTWIDIEGPARMTLLSLASGLEKQGASE